MKSIAVLEKVSYLYPGSTEFALNGISLDIRQGEFFGIIGPTGAGKTTLCSTLNGIVPQFYGGRFFGHITVAGLDTLSHSVSALARYSGAVFEDPDTQLIATSVENEIAFALENLSRPRAEILARIPEVLAAVRLEGMEKRHPQELSGGQKQRLAIAAALAVRPALLILDEPTSQLDPIGSQEVFATVRELNREWGITVVMVSHAAEEMAEFCDRIALLSQGSIEAIDKPDRIFSEIDLLIAQDLRSPQVARTFYDIGQRGIAVPVIPVTLAEGLKAISILSTTANLIPPPLFSQPPSRVDQSPLLSVQHLHHVYEDGTVALREVSLDIHTGEYLLIVGQNGAGKSTLVKHFLNLLQPTSGRVMIRQQEAQTLSVSDLAKFIGYVAQNPDNQIFNTTVEKEVAFALENLGYPTAWIQEQVCKSLTEMNLWERRQAHPLSLPKGDRARVVIAAILAMEPDTIIFDEPTTGQDYRGACSILEVTRQLHRLGKTVIVITHHLYLMPDYAERVIVMGQGTILLDAPTRQAYHQTALLESTYLTPPQAVLLAQKLSFLQQEDYPLLTPEEIAVCFTPK